SGESKAIVNELSHHRFALHAKAACLHRVFILAAHSDDAPVFEMHLETTERVAELARALDHLVCLQRSGLACEVEIGHPSLCRRTFGYCPGLRVQAQERNGR